MQENQDKVLIHPTMVFRPYTRRGLGIVGAACVLLGAGGLFVFVSILRTQTTLRDPIGYVVLAIFGGVGSWLLLSGLKCLKLAIAMRHKLVRDEQSFRLLLQDGSTLPSQRQRRTWVYPLPGGELWYFQQEKRRIVLDCRLAEPESTEADSGHGF